MNLIEVTKRYATKEACLEYLEQMRWPNGVCCLKCGITGQDDKGREVISKFTTNETTRERFSKKKQKMVTVKVPARSLYQCKECGYQFSATTGTIFHDSHLPLEKWFMAVALIMNAKKGISALQVGRDLGIDQADYKTVWYLCHRIREAMCEGGLLTGVVETDATFLTPKKPRKGNPKRKKQDTDVVLGMRERGGRLRLIPVADEKMASVEPVIREHISGDALLQTDKFMSYEIIGRRLFPGRHRMIDHIRTYAEGENHTNTIENAFSLLKRGVYGTFHKVSIKHLGRYCNEFSYRFNRRDSQKQIFHETMKGLLRGNPLPYRKLTA
ncbi:MAG TPA: IS1595 family transposase [Candidatus Acidoferrum sp.]|nr:IS1595 family transposase [Candidatus Acidoferrum sp.]